MAYDKDDIRSRVLLTVSRVESTRKPGSGYMIRVVQYHKKDGTNIAVKVGVGEFYKHEEGGEERFKAKEWGKKDFAAVTARWAEIKPLIDNPPAAPAEGTQQADEAAAKKDDEVPFS